MRTLSIIGIVLAAIGIYFSLVMMGGVTDEEVGYGFLGLMANGYWLGYSITGLKNY